MRRLLVAASAAVLLLSGCGGSDDSDAAEDFLGELDDLPACDDVWQVGATLDLDSYEGCKNGDTIEAVVTSGCYDAKSQYVGQYATFEDRLWVVQEGTDQKTGEGGTPGEITDADPNC